LLPHRKARGKVCMFKSPEILSKDARDRGVVESWPQNVLRHSFCSYRLAETKSSFGLVAEEMGNSPEMVRRHYRRAISQGKSTAKQYFDIRPDNLAAEIIDFAEPESTEEKVG